MAAEAGDLALSSAAKALDSGTLQSFDFRVDLPNGRSAMAGLERILTGIEGLSFVRLTSRDVVRHRIVQDIVDAYERAANTSTPSGNRKRR